MRNRPFSSLVERCFSPLALCQNILSITIVCVMVVMVTWGVDVIVHTCKYFYVVFICETTTSIMRCIGDVLLPGISHSLTLQESKICAPIIDRNMDIFTHKI